MDDWYAQHQAREERLSALYGREIELHEDGYDPTYGSSEPQIFRARICKTCWSLVPDSVLDEHANWHAG